MYQNRAAYIDELQNFINCSKNSFDSVLKTINWSKQSLLSVKEEEEACQNPEEVAVHSTSPTEEGTAVEGGGDLLYNDIVASLLVNEQPSKTVKKKVKAEDKAAALIQLLKMERDAKRRRMSYRNKVHTKNKSHTEVLREVLEEQMLTITGSNERDSCAVTNDRLQKSTNQAQELIAIQPPQGNPHLAWVGILEKAEGDRKRSDLRSDKFRAQKSEHNIHSVDHKESYKNDEEKERKKHRKNMKRKVEDNGKHHDREKKSEWDDMDRPSPNYKDRHHKKKKKKRSRSRSPRPDISEHHRHKSKHKKKKH